MSPFRSRLYRGITGKRLGVLIAISVVATGAVVGGGFWLHGRIPGKAYLAGWVDLSCSPPRSPIASRRQLQLWVGAVATIALLFKRAPECGRPAESSPADFCFAGRWRSALLLAEARRAMWLRLVHRQSRPCRRGGLRGLTVRPVGFEGAELPKK